MKKRKFGNPHPEENAIFINGHGIPMMWCIMDFLTDEFEVLNAKELDVFFKNGLRWVIHTENDYKYVYDLLTKSIETLLKRTNDKYEYRRFKKNLVALHKYASHLNINFSEEIKSAA